MRKTLYSLFFLIIQPGFAQEHAGVYFKDKEVVAQALAYPITVLIREAIDGKNLHAISIDDRDVAGNKNHSPFGSGEPTADIRIKANVRAMSQQIEAIPEDSMIYPHNNILSAHPVMAGPGIIQYVSENSSDDALAGVNRGYDMPDFEMLLNAVSLSVKQEEQQNISIYPNPVKSYFEVVFASAIGELQIEVYDILGKKIITQTITPENNTINVSKFSKGVYMVRISSEKAIKIFKIVKQ